MKTPNLDPKKSRLLDQLKDFCEQIIAMKRNMGNHPSFKYFGIEDFIMKHGQAFKSQPLPDEYKEDLGTKKECFKNAHELMLNHPGLIYCEGYGLSDRLPLPIHHAWCVDEEGAVVDVTWDNPEQSVYFGVPFDFEYVMKAVTESGYYGLIDNYTERWPLLTGKHKDFLHRW